jgi:hypothetical protein
MALGQVLSQSLSRNEHFVAPVKRAPVSHPSTSLSKDLNRLLSAAIVSPHFRSLLLSNPIAALTAGYNGETFQLTPAEYATVTSLRVSTMRDFAAQLLHMLQSSTEDAAHHAPQSQVAIQPQETLDEQVALHSRRQEADKPHSRHTAPSHGARRTVAAGEGSRGGYSAKIYGA